MPSKKMEFNEENFDEWNLQPAVPEEWEDLIYKLHPITAVVVWEVLTNNVSPMTIALAQSSPDWDRYTAIRIVGSGDPTALVDIAENARPDLDEIFSDHIPNYKSRRIIH